MAKTLKQILDGVKSSKLKTKDILGDKPGVDYSPKAGDERKFADKHHEDEHADRVGNKSDVYQATNVKYYMDTDKAERHGYKSGEDEKVYESAEDEDEKKRKAASDHYEKHVIPHFEKHGLTPAVAKLIDAHVKKHGSYQVYNWHGNADGSHPSWFDNAKQKVKPLKRATGWVHEEAKCNMTEEGKLCEVHGMKACPTGKMLREKPVKEDLDEGFEISESRVVAAKSVMNPRGGEDRYELHHTGTGKGWHSIIKTHQDGNDLKSMVGFHNVVHVGTEKYINGKWKSIKHAQMPRPMEPVKEDLDPYNPKDIGFDFKYGGHHTGRKAEVHRMPEGHYEVRKYKNPGAGLGTGEHVETVKHNDRVKAGIEAQKFATMKEGVERIDEKVKTTHENPLVSVYDAKGRLHTHANLSVANAIHNTNVKHTDVHKDVVKTKSGWEHKNPLTFKLSPHHDAFVAKDTNEEVVSELLVQNYVSGAKGKSAEVHKNLNAGTYNVKKMVGDKLVSSSEHDDSAAAHAAAKKHLGEETVTVHYSGSPYHLKKATVKKRHANGNIDVELPHSEDPKRTRTATLKPGNYIDHTNEEVELDEKAAVAKSKQTILVTAKGNKSGGGVMRIKKSDYDPNKHSLAEDQEQIDELSKKTLKGYVKGAQDDIRATAIMRDRSQRMSTARGDEWDDEAQWLNKHAKKRVKGIYKATNKIQEREMTDAEMDKREHIVKGMKKKLSDFRARYGKRAKDVMYATATKNAMKEEAELDDLELNEVYVIHKIYDNGYASSQLPKISFDSKKEAKEYAKNREEQYKEHGYKFEVRKHKMGGLKPERTAAAKKIGVKEDLAQPLIGSMDPTKEKKKKKEMEQTAPAVTPITLPNFSADVNTGRNV
jgi:hypothetical protein